MHTPLLLRLAPRRPLGRTGFVATPLGIGDLADRSLPVAECVATLHRAMDYGLNVIDTAPGYENGYSEEVVGAALKGRRERLFVIDKIDFHDQPAGPQLEGSLRRLGLDHVDLLVIHGLSTPAGWRQAAEPGGLMDQIEDCIRAGTARFRGISSHDPATLRLALESGRCDVVMFPVGPFVHPRYVEEILPLARRLGVGTVCFKTFGAGKLVGDTLGYGRPLADSDNRWRPGMPPKLPHLEIADCVHYTMTCDPDVALLGMSTTEELDAAVQAATAFEPLPPDRMTEIRRQAALAAEGKGTCHWDPAEA